MKKLFYGCILLLFYSSCFPGNKKKNACDKEALLTDTRIFSMKSDDIYIDHTYCIKFMDEVICLQGRIENKRSLQENILLLNIPHIDSLNNEMSSGLGYLNEETATWFNPVQLNKDPHYFHYYQKMSVNTQKWVYYRDGGVSDTFYVALMNM